MDGVVVIDVGYNLGSVGDVEYGLVVE